MHTVDKNHEIIFPSPRSLPARLLRIGSALLAIALLLFPLWVGHHLRRDSDRSDAPKLDNEQAHRIKTAPRVSPQDERGAQPVRYDSR
jgi:hypothetical protein